MILSTYAKTFSLLTRSERRRLFVLLGCMVVTALIETFVVASVMPFMALVAQADSQHLHPLLERFVSSAGFADTAHATLFVGGSVLCLIVVGNLTAALTLVLLHRTDALLIHRLSHRLLAVYLCRPFEHSLRDNSSRQNRNIIVEVSNAVNFVIHPTLFAVSRLVTVCSILLLLLFLRPLLSLFLVLVLGSLYPLLYLLVRTMLKRNGEQHLVVNREMARIVAESFGGIKEIKLLGREQEFLSRYHRTSYQVARHQTIGGVVPQMPRYFMEIVAFGGVIMLILHLMRSGQPIGAVLPLITLYAMAGYRLMPALQQAFSSLATARFHRPSLDLLCSDFAGSDPLGFIGAQPRSSDRLPFCKEIRLDNVSYRYEGSLAPAVNAIDLTIRACTTVAFVGPSGAGKTTLVDLILGLLQLQQGRILVDGAPLVGTNRAAWQRNLGYVPQSIFLADDTVARNIAFGIPAAEIDRAAVERAARSANLHDFVVNQLPAGYDTVVGERGVRLSGGERQRIGIARALYLDPPVLVLDEATSSLDGITEDAILEAIQTLAGRKTIIMIAHRFTTIMDCDHIFFLDKGGIVAQGTYRELLDTQQQFREMAKQKT
ncbi:MAG: ATP-binding cassette domain-containing protein [Geobacter sp.]|nr:ATP-binding cassette domain-containing protein [Geobacter sp.]